ncbi:MAG: hypothetical protein GXO35_06040 [Gammaproteobacteria bacterium]|nr:hypothetical protein [Gammaproteobacteria bacterium]
MTKLWLLLIFLLIFKPKLSVQKYIGRLVSIHRLPAQSEKLFEIQVPTEKQCTNICFQNPVCFVVLYNRSGSSCYGYGTGNLTDGHLVQDVKSWQILYDGKYK